MNKSKQQLYDEGIKELKESLMDKEKDAEILLHGTNIDAFKQAQQNGLIPRSELEKSSNHWMQNLQSEENKVYFACCRNNMPYYAADQSCSQIPEYGYSNLDECGKFIRLKNIEKYKNRFTIDEDGKKAFQNLLFYYQKPDLPSLKSYLTREQRSSILYSSSVQCYNSPLPTKFIKALDKLWVSCGNKCVIDALNENVPEWMQSILFVDSMAIKGKIDKKDLEFTSNTIYDYQNLYNNAFFSRGCPIEDQRLKIKYITNYLNLNEFYDILQNSNEVYEDLQSKFELKNTFDIQYSKKNISSKKLPSINEINISDAKSLLELEAVLKQELNHSKKELIQTIKN